MLAIKRRYWIFIPLTILLLLALTPQLLRADSPEQDELQAIWERVRQAGAYNFSTELEQTLTPESTAVNAGREVKETRLLMEGQADMAAETMHMTLWSGSGSVLAPETGVQFKVEDGRSYTRQGGGHWEETEDFTTMVAPGGDFMGYVQAAENVVRHEPEWRATIGEDYLVTRYTFDINGRKFAEYVREQMQQQEGLPPGIEVQLPQAYLNMNGQGELLVGAGGMPLRQQFDLQFPETDGYHTSAIVTTDFSDFRAVPVLSTATAVGKSVGEAAQGMTPVVITLIVLLSMALFVRYRNSKQVYAYVAIIVIASMLLSPLLTSMRVYAYQGEQSARQAEQEAQRAEQESREEQQALLLSSSFDPNTDPLQQARQSKQEEGVAATASATNNSSKYADPLCESDPSGDEDGDTLTNLQECLLGTLPGTKDSDGDLVDDNVEVAGIALTYNGTTTTWYTDPLSMDSNNDSIADGKEWNLDANNDGKPDDTDGDGVPDMWDQDNDGDGVPDVEDLSDYATTKGTTSFDGDKPMQLLVDDLIYNSQAQASDQALVKVEFQLSPTDAEHLWYSHNVLDWPDNDRQGQIQDADGKSFFDVDPTLDPTPNDWGDMRLVPMLEIEISGPPDNLPSDEILKQFGISVQQTTASTKVAYVPLQLVSDQHGDKNVAFYGRMFYRTASSWGNAHQVRLVWIVQALVDQCKTFKNGICSEYKTMNDLQVVQTYDDEWFLTGLHVTEEHGADMAIIYEDPAVTDKTSAGSAYDKPFYMDTLFGLLYGLDNSYLAGSDCDTTKPDGTCSGNGQRDVTVASIATDFNHSSNGLPITGGEENFKLPNVLTVERNQYDALDLGIQQTTITNTLSVLNTNFSSHWSAAEPITPTIMLAYDQTFRALNLDEMLGGNPNMSLSGSTLTASLPTSGDNKVVSQTVATVKWTPYAYDPASGWTTADMEAYWDAMNEHLGSSFTDYTDQDEARTYQTMSQLIYLSAFNAEQNVVVQDNKINFQVYQQSISTLGAKLTADAGKFIKQTASNYFKYSSTLKEAADLVNPATGETTGYAKAIPQFLWQKLSAGQEGAAGVAIAVTVLLLVVTAGIAEIEQHVAHNTDVGWKIAAGVSVGVLITAIVIIKPIMEVVKLVLFAVSADVSVGEAVLKILTADSSLLGASRAAGYVGLVISIGVSIGIFIYAVSNGHVKAGSIEFNELLAATIAAIIVALILFILSVSVVGTILVGLILVIDSILAAIGVKWSITGWLTKAITGWLYRYDPAAGVDVSTDLAISLKDPNAGFVNTNQITYKLPITSTLVFTDVNGVPDPDKQRDNTLIYELDAKSKDLSASKGQISADWTHGVTNTVDILGVDYVSKSETLTFSTMPTATINLPGNLMLNTGYDLLGDNCWVFGIGCGDHWQSGSNSAPIGNGLAFDVFPATLKDFVDVDTWTSGQIRFPDVDGDGLLSFEAGGVDPNPTDWDSDNDGLADGYEAAIRAKTADQGGVNLNLLSPDSDGDLIGDGDEIRLGTNPGNADSDDDGIPDIEEVAYVVDIHGDPIFGGWDLPYAPNKTTRVWSDPLHADADGDGLSDLFERTQDTCPTCLPWQDPKNPLVYNPKVWNESPVPLYFTDDTARGYVVPGASLVYTTTTANNLSSGQSLVGDLSLDLPPTFSGGPLAAGVDIPSGGQQSLVSELTAADATQPISGTLTGHMQLTDLGSVVWSWDAVSSEMDDSLAGSILSLKAASVQGWAAPYLLVTQEMPSPTDPSFVIVGYLASAAGRIVDSRVLHRSGKGESPNGMPDVACTDDGDCLIVFSTWLGATYPIKSILLRQQLASTGAQTLWTDSIQPSWPVVGSNPSGANEGFMVSWNTNADNKWQGLALPILDNGVAPANSNHIDAGGNIVLVSNPAQIFDTSTPTNIAGITWGGAHYQAFSPGTNGLNIALLDPLSGKPTPGGKVLSGYGYANAIYDQVSKQTLLLHQQQGNKQGLFATILPPDLSPGATTTLAQQIPNVAPLCADPKNGGWLAAWPKENSKVINYQAIGPSGSVRGAVHTIATTSDEPFLALACEYPRPILELHFEEKQGAHLFADTSGLGNTATCISCPDAGQQGRFGNGLFFQATNKEFLTVPSGSIDHIHQSVSFSAWVKPGWTANSMGYNPAILALRDSSNTAYSLHIRDDYSALDLFNGSAVSSMSYNFTPEVMVHVAVVMENDSWTAYIDGEAVGTKTVSLGSTTNLPFHIGSSTGNGEFFTGIIDEVVVWPRALSSNEIGDAFNAATTIYDLDEVAGSVAMIDSSNNGFNASCSEANGTCPTMGVAGKADTAAQFDGVNDFLVIEPISQTVAVHGYTFDTADSALHFEKSTEDSDLDIINFDDATGLDNYAQCFEFSCPTASAVGHEGKGVHFDGASKQNLNLRDSLSLDHTAFTIAAWAKRDSTGKAMAILSQGGVASTNQWLSFGFRDNDKFTCAFYADDLDSTAAYTDTDWHHWVCSYDSLNNVRNLYRDGQLIATDQPSKNGLEVSGWDIFIGMNAATTWLFSGTIDDVGIWRRFLTTEEVGKLYKDGLDLYTNAFDGWSQKRIEQVHTSSDRSLGTFVPYANTALGFFDNEQGSEPVLTLDGLPIHDTIDVKFDIKTIGRWDGTDTANGPDNWHWGYDGLEAFLTSFVWLGQEVQDYTGYYQAYPDSANKFSGEVANPPFSHMTNLFQLFGQGLNGQSYALDGTGDHIKDSIELYFQLDSKGYQPGFEEQFALDNVVVTIKRENTTIPLADRSFTLSAWAKHDNPGQPGAILSQGEVATNQGLVFGFRDDRFTCAFWNDDLNVQIANDDSDWHLWACTYDAGSNTRAIYRDGVQIAQDSASGNYTGLGATYIGQVFDGEWPFKGTIDEVGI
ncbi:MAG: hypothetical protein GY759_15275 [Chloroflexi bacterium]|nr:hypothetical protein [Chloroflexota bacterium]